MKFLYFFLLIFTVHAQDLPDWVYENVEYSEQFADDLESLKLLKINIFNTNLTDLKIKLYFVPDSLLEILKKSPELLSQNDHKFLSQFISHENRFVLNGYNYYKSDLDETQYISNHDSKSIVQLSSSVYHKNFGFYYYQNKKITSQNLSTPRFLIESKNKILSVRYGHQKIKGINHLVFESGYGRIFYPTQLKSNRLNDITVNIEKTKDLKTSTKGLSLDLNFDHTQLFLLRGNHDYFSSDNAGSFSSFNSVFDREKNEIQESISLISLNKRFSQHQIQFAAMYLDFENNYIAKKPYIDFNEKKLRIYGLMYIYDDPLFKLNGNVAYLDDNGYAVDYSIQHKMNLLEIYFNQFYYQPNFINPKSKSIIHGQSLPMNKHGVTMSFRKKLFDMSTIEYGYVKTESYISESVNIFEIPKEQQYLNIRTKYSSLGGTLYLKDLKFNKGKYQLDYYLKKNHRISWIYRTRGSDFGNQFSFKSPKLFLEVAKFNTDAHWQIYEYGIGNEFVNSHFYSPSYRVIMAYKLDLKYINLHMKYIYIYQNKNNFETEHYIIKGHNRNSISLFSQFML